MQLILPRKLEIRAISGENSVWYKLVEEVLGHLKDGGVVVLHPAAGEDEAGGGVGQVVRERHVDVERRAWVKR